MIPENLNLFERAFFSYKFSCFYMQMNEKEKLIYDR